MIDLGGEESDFHILESLDDGRERKTDERGAKGTTEHDHRGGRLDKGAHVQPFQESAAENRAETH